MLPARLAVLSAFLLIASIPSLSQQPTTSASPPQNSEGIISLQSSFGALSGLVGTGPSSLIAAGTYTRLPDSSKPDIYTISIETLGVQSFRSDVLGPSGTTAVIVNGTSGWVKDSAGSRALTVGETFGRGIEMFPTLLIARWLATPTVVVAQPAQETINDVPVLRISVTPPSAVPANSVAKGGYERFAKCDLYIDPRTNLPVRVRVFEHPTDHRLEVPVDLDFSDYRAVGGAQFPFTITYSAGGQNIARLQLQTISVNASVSASDFEGVPQ